MWIDVCNLMYENRFKFYEYAPFETEWFSLDHDANKHKVDHPKKNDDGSVGSKDVADAIVGAVFNCLYDVSKNPSYRIKQNLDSFNIVQMEEEGVDMSWVIPRGYRGKNIKVGYDKVE